MHIYIYVYIYIYIYIHIYVVIYLISIFTARIFFLGNKSKNFPNTCNDINKSQQFFLEICCALPTLSALYPLSNVEFRVVTSLVLKCVRIRRIYLTLARKARQSVLPMLLLTLGQANFSVKDQMVTILYNVDCIQFLSYILCLLLHNFLKMYISQLTDHTKTGLIQSWAIGDPSCISQPLRQGQNNSSDVTLSHLFTKIF